MNAASSSSGASTPTTPTIDDFEEEEERFVPRRKLGLCYAQPPVFAVPDLPPQRQRSFSTDDNNNRNRSYSLGSVAVDTSWMAHFASNGQQMISPPPPPPQPSASSRSTRGAAAERGTPATTAVAVAIAQPQHRSGDGVRGASHVLMDAPSSSTGSSSGYFTPPGQPLPPVPPPRDASINLPRLHHAQPLDWRASHASSTRRSEAAQSAMTGLPQPHFAQRRSISTVTGPGQREIHQFYQQFPQHQPPHFAHPNFPAPYPPQQPQHAGGPPGGGFFQGPGALGRRSPIFDSRRFSPPNFDDGRGYDDMRAPPPPQPSTNGFANNFGGFPPPPPHSNAGPPPPPPNYNGYQENYNAFNRDFPPAPPRMPPPPPPQPPQGPPNQPPASVGGGFYREPQPPPPPGLQHGPVSTRNQEVLNEIMSFTSADELIHKELAQMSFPELPAPQQSQPAPPQPPNFSTNNVKAESPGYGPLEIDVDSPETFYDRQRSEAAAVAAASLGGHGRTKSEPGDEMMRTPDGHCGGPGTSGADADDEGGPSNHPLNVRKKSRGKPENVCQLLHSISHRPFARKAHSVAMRKPSLLGQKSQLRSPRFFEVSVTGGGGAAVAPYTPPPILSPMRSGSGLFWQITRALSQSSQISPLCNDASTIEKAPPVANAGAEDEDMEAEGDGGLKIDEDGAGPSGADDLPPVGTPVRKNGFFCMTNQHHKVSFAAELEALRKDSASSHKSSTSERTTTIAVDALRKASSVSLDAALRKASTYSDCYYDYNPQESDATPHINLGRDFQARVKKWADREITREELDAIPDRDDAVFDCNLVDHLEPEQLAAYELLACSQAVPRPGRNRELALHLLMENKGNLEAAVGDLLRSDTLDWEQYPVVFNWRYPDVDMWSPEEVLSFQDAIYKTEKDFHQVAQELGNKTVKQCVEFYYMWKKACPDDYRKLRNLRRKRQLLEMHQQAQQDLTQDPAAKDRMEEGDSSDTESEATAPSYTPQLDAASIFDTRISHPSPSLQIRKRSASTMERGSAGPTSLSPLGQSLTSAFSLHTQKYQPTQPRGTTSVKKGAQPSADGFFHCRLCDKCFEKVKSLNAHMKSHAMKARAEAEAQAQQQAQVQQQHNNAAAALTSSQASQALLSQSLLGSQAGQALLNHTLLGNQGVLGQALEQHLLAGIPHPRPQHPLHQQLLQPHNLTHPPIIH